MWNYRSLLQLSLLVIILTTKNSGCRPAAAKINGTTFNANLDAIFKIGQGLVVFNTTNEMPANDGIFCTEQRNGLPFCTEVPDYLEVTQLDKFKPEEFDKFKPYFKVDFVPQRENITTRMGDEPMESYFCNSKTRVVYPKVAETTGSKWLMVVQHKQYRQGVLVELCENENAPCKYEELLPFGITTRCRQHFVHRSLVVLVDGVMQERMLKLPNACKCVLRNAYKS